MQTGIVHTYVYLSWSNTETPTTWQFSTGLRHHSCHRMVSCRAPFLLQIQTLQVLLLFPTSRMEAAAAYLLGEHDFRNLCKLYVQRQLTSFKRTILSPRWPMKWKKRTIGCMSSIFINSAMIFGCSKPDPQRKRAAIICRT